MQTIDNPTHVTPVIAACIALIVGANDQVKAHCARMDVASSLATAMDEPELAVVSIDVADGGLVVVWADGADDSYKVLVDIKNNNIEFKTV